MLALLASLGLASPLRKVNNEDVLEAHLSQMREKMDGKKLEKELKLKEEREALNRVKQDMED